jgi:hypothetical protein
MAHTSSVYASLTLTVLLQTSPKDSGPKPGRVDGTFRVDEFSPRVGQAISRLALLRETKILRSVGIIGS